MGVDACCCYFCGLLSVRICAGDKFPYLGITNRILLGLTAGKKYGCEICRYCLREVLLFYDLRVLFADPLLYLVLLLVCEGIVELMIMDG